MSFTETRLEVGVPSSSGGVTFRTTSTRVGSGFEKRTPGRNEYLYQGDVGKILLSEKQVAYVVAFFNARKGRAVGFRYKYWADYQVTSEPRSVDPFTTTQGVASLVPGSSNVFQLQKKYTSFGISSLKTIVKPCVGTVQVFVDGILQTGATVDHTEGKVTIDPTPAPGAMVTWSGEFDLPVRFDSDKLPGLVEFLDPKTKELLFRFDSLPIVEINNSISNSVVGVPGTVLGIPGTWYAPYTTEFGGICNGTSVFSGYSNDVFNYREEADSACSAGIRRTYYQVSATGVEGTLINSCGCGAFLTITFTFAPN